MAVSQSEVAKELRVQTCVTRINLAKGLWKWVLVKHNIGEKSDLKVKFGIQQGNIAGASVASGCLPREGFPENGI